MRSIETDVVVVGAGTAGLAAWRAARAAGARAVIVEGGAYGTTCARVGCMPSKLLIAAAEAAHATERFGRFGIRLDGSVKVDGRAVMARVVNATASRFRLKAWKIPRPTTSAATAARAGPPAGRRRCRDPLSR
jgi:pyruvate/2-oxoglutarate dehydrogenase complex dihydrolipoamide dehydrogenase (E3) component